MQQLLLFVVILLILGLSFTVTRWRGGLHMTFSQHAAVTRQAKLFYAFLFLVTLPLFAWFIVGWFVPHKHLPASFVWFTYTAVVFQILCTWFPEEGGWKTLVHRLLTAISAIAMLPLIVILGLSMYLSPYMRGLAWVAFGSMVALLMVAFTHQKGYKRALLLQIGYYAVFFLMMLLLTYF